MVEPIEISGLAGWIALSLPVLALVTVVFLALRRRAKRDGDTVSGRYGEPLAKKQPAAPRDAAPAASSPERSRQLTPADVKQLQEDIRRAEAGSDETRLAKLYLTLGRVRLGEGKVDEAQALFDRCLGFSVRHGLKVEHAGVRLELGDIAERTGDLTSACEHWQMARELFDDLKESESVAQAEAKMRSNGCPTDWVLNDF